MYGGEERWTRAQYALYERRKYKNLFLNNRLDNDALNINMANLNVLYF